MKMQSKKNMTKKIKSLLIKKFDYYFDDNKNEVVEQEGVRHEFTEYNKNALLTSEIKYDHNGMMIDRIEKKFDDKDKVLEEILFDENNELVERRTFERNENGKIVLGFLHYLDGSVDTTTYIYNENGDLIEKTIRDSDGDSDGREVFTYNNGKRATEESFDENNELITKNRYLFNDRGHLMEVSNWTADEGMMLRTVNKYDENGDVERILRYDIENNLIEKSIYELDDKARVVKIIEEDQYKKVETHIEYDADGNVIEQQQLNSEGEINHRIVRKYDNENNVIESEVAVNGHGVDISQHYLMRYEYEFFGQ